MQQLEDDDDYVLTLTVEADDDEIINQTHCPFLNTSKRENGWWIIVVEENSNKILANLKKTIT